MTTITGRSRSIRLAGLMALTLSFVAGVPGLTTGPLGGNPVVAPVAATNPEKYVRVSSLQGQTQAMATSMPRLTIKMSIRGGDLSKAISNRYAYHYPTTSWPGGRSNIYIYAHAHAGAFLNVKNARKGDLVVLTLTTGASVKYKVTGIRSAAWNAGEWIMPTGSDRITLQTYLGRTATSRRLIVTAVPAYQPSRLGTAWTRRTRPP